MDGHDIPAEAFRREGRLHLRARGRACVSFPRRIIWKLDAAILGHLGGSTWYLRSPVWYLFAQLSLRCVHADRNRHADRAGSKKRHSHCGNGQAAPRTRHAHSGSSGRSCQPAAEADSYDLIRVHPGCRSTSDCQRRGRCGSPCSRYRRLQRDAGSHAARGLCCPRTVRPRESSDFASTSARPNAGSGTTCPGGGRWSLNARGLGIAPLLVVLTGCALGPNYKRPKVQTPTQYRQPAQASVPAGKNSMADLAWVDLFHDETITNLVRTALRQSYDLQAVTERVLQARAQSGITRSQLAPQLSGSVSHTSARTSGLGPYFIPPASFLAASYTQAGLNLNWEIDVWGRLRRLTESARAQYLAQEEARHAVISSLIADVITTYLNLRELDLELEIARKTEDIAQSGLRITRLRRERGVAAGLDIRQAEQLLYTATTQIAATERAIIDTENVLNVLLGQNPGDIPRGKPLVQFNDPSEVPAGLPSDLVERRPDVRQAEQTLIAANAQIGAAKALFFPQITLTGFLGVQSRALSELFTGPARSQDISPAALLPIFNAGQLRNNVRLTEAQQREALASYRKTIVTALQEVSNALTDYEKIREQQQREQALVDSLTDAGRLATLRYRGGLDSYLQVLDAQRNQFSGELVLAQLRKNKLLSLVELYRALGGGWQNP